jgi:hypothetical protein
LDCIAAEEFLLRSMEVEVLRVRTEVQVDSSSRCNMKNNMLFGRNLVAVKVSISLAIFLREGVYDTGGCTKLKWKMGGPRQEGIFRKIVNGSCLLVLMIFKTLKFTGNGEQDWMRCNCSSNVIASSNRRSRVCATDRSLVSSMSRMTRHSIIFQVS